MQRRLRGSQAHFLCHLHGLKAEVKLEKEIRKEKQKMEAFLLGTRKEGNTSGLHSTVNHSNFGNKLPPRIPF